MAFRATNIIPAKGLEIAKDEAVQAKAYADRTIAALLSDTTSGVIIGIVSDLDRIRGRLNDVKSIPGLAAYAIDQENDALYDVVAEFNLLITRIDEAIDEVLTTFPKDAADWILARKLFSDGTQDRIFAPAATAGLRTRLQAISDQVV